MRHILKVKDMRKLMMIDPFPLNPIDPKKPVEPPEWWSYEEEDEDDY